ncbi:hypothetical protein ACFBZI_08795 [Moraxella sp. ZJ142]|uniref:hypothetical protein n=1 Tax=Moraxella marmotae TaxID=3344520 RepID=UPI0035D5067B
MMRIQSIKKPKLAKAWAFLVGSYIIAQKAPIKNAANRQRIMVAIIAHTVDKKFHQIKY